MANICNVAMTLDCLSGSAPHLHGDELFETGECPGCGWRGSHDRRCELQPSWMRENAVPQSDTIQAN